MKKTIVAAFVALSCTTQAFADDLATIYALAKDNDPLVNRAEAQRDLAYAGIDVSRASLLPQLSGYVDYTISESESITASDEGVIQTTESNTFTYGIDLSMSLYDHANWLGLNRAELVAQQSDAALAASYQSLITRTINAYLAVLREKDNVEFVKAELKAIERQLEQTKQRFEVGLTAITDVHEAQANYDNTVAQQIRAENSLELRLEEMREITGRYHKNIAPLNKELFSAVAPSPNTANEWLTLAEEKNLTLLSQRFAKDIAKEDIDIATSGHYPSLSLSASYDVSDSDSEIDLPIGSATNNPDPLASNSIGITLSVPIYSGGSVKAGVDQAKANYVVASENLELSYRQTVREVRSSFNDVRASISTIRALEQSVISAESALQATEAGFDVGTRTIVDVLDSTRNLFDARRNLADARYSFISSIVSLKEAAGTLTEKDLQDINKILSDA